MTSSNLICVGNAIIDILVKVEDSFLKLYNLKKGKTNLLIGIIIIKEIYRGEKQKILIKFGSLKLYYSKQELNLELNIMTSF